MKPDPWGPGWRGIEPTAAAAELTASLVAVFAQPLTQVEAHRAWLRRLVSDLDDDPDSAA